MPFTGPAEDRLALRELLETYADAVTRCDAQAWGDTWAEDAQWSLPDYPEIGTTQGRAAIVAMWVSGPRPRAATAWAKRWLNATASP